MQNGVVSTLDLWVCQYVTVSNTRPIKVADLKVPREILQNPHHIAVPSCPAPLCSDVNAH